MERIKNFVAVHKQAPLYGDESYQFIHVGAARNPISIDGAVKDNEYEDNISSKNDIYCELTGYYHIWKHVHDVDYVGFCHYRRFFAHKRFCYDNNANILSGKELLDILKEHDVILGAPSSKNGARHGCFPTQAEIEEFFPYRIMMPVIKKLYPDYAEEFNREFFIGEMSFCNMFVCSKDIFDNYCKFLFDVLFKVEEHLKMENIGGVAPREMGYFSEWLLNVWVRKNKLKVSYQPTLFIDDNKNWHYMVKYLLQQLGLEQLISRIEYYIRLKKKL